MVDQMCLGFLEASLMDSVLDAVHDSFIKPPSPLLGFNHIR